MAAVLAAFLVGGLVGLLVRPVLDAYITWKTARFLDEATRTTDDSVDDDTLTRRPHP